MLQPQRDAFVKLLNSLRKRINHFRRFPQVATYRSARFVLDPRESLDRKIMSGQDFERAELDFAVSKIAERKLAHIVDVGANFGLYTVLLGRCETVKTVDAFEPVRRTFNQLGANVYANRLDHKVSQHRCALGAENGDAVIKLAPGDSVLSRIALLETDTPDRYTETERITIHRGDDVLSHENELLYIKIDVEGYAHKVLQGLPRILERNSGVIQVEIFPNADEVHRVLGGFGWRFLEDISARSASDAFFEK